MFRLALIGCVLLLTALSTIAHAQRSLAQLREQLVAPWLVTVQDGDRYLLLRITEISQDTEGSFLLSANFGWIDGPQTIVRIELIESKQDLALIIRTNSGTIYSVRQTASGEFAGTWKTERGAVKEARLQKLGEDQIPQKVKESEARMAARVFADEDRDWGVAPTKSPRSGRLHAPTPTAIPGAKTIRTMELQAMLGRTPAPVLIDVLDGDGHRTIPGAHWLPEPGKSSFGDAQSERFRQDLERLTKGSKSAPMVFFCLSSECWLSYNAGLRAIESGYTNVYWFRGGTSAWQRAGFETRESELYRR